MANDPYLLSFTRSARKSLTRLGPQFLERCEAAIDALAQEPRPQGCLKIVSEDGVWRIRVGDYRVGYIVDDQARTVKIVRVGHRSDFYD